MEEQAKEFLKDDEKWIHLQSGIMEWAGAQEFDFPWREPAEEWRLLVTEVLLQRTRASAVAKIYEEFFERFSTVQSLADATEEEILEQMSSLGLLWRAKWLGKLGTALLPHDGAVPESRAELETLPGVGPYAAGAFLTLHRNQNAPFVDANVVRLLGRYFGFQWDGKTRRKGWFLQLVERMFLHDYEPGAFGYAVLDFTREVCGTMPLHTSCPVSDLCHATSQNRETSVK